MSLFISRIPTIRNEALQDHIDVLAQTYTQKFQSDSTTIFVYNYTNGQIKYVAESPVATGGIDIDFNFLINPFIYALALDNKTITLDDKYSSITSADTFPYDIKNVDVECNDTITFEKSLIFGCNFGAIRAFQSLGSSPITAYSVFVERMRNFGFDMGKKNILSGDILPFAMGLAKETDLVSLAVAYGALINGGKYIEPTFDGIGRKLQAISLQTSRTMKSMLMKIVSENSVFDYMKVYGNTIGGYSVTHEKMSVFVGFVEDKDYIVVVAITNPKVKIKNTGLAGVVFGEVIKKIDIF